MCEIRLLAVVAWWDNTEPPFRFLLFAFWSVQQMLQLPW